MQIVASVQGALLMARLTSDPRVLDKVAAELRGYLGYARPAPKFQMAGRGDVTL
jgi:hypothetical protein